MIQGRLEEMSILDLMQSLEMGQKSCRLTIRNAGDTCELFFAARQCTDAKLGATEGEDAVFQVVRWPAGEFEIDFNESPTRSTISRTTTGLLMEALRLTDEELARRVKTQMLKSPEANLRKVRSLLTKPEPQKPCASQILTISDSVASGKNEDQSGPAVAGRCRELGWTIASTSVLSDDRVAIESFLKKAADSDDADLILTTGGTGVGPRDITPEATTAVAERLIPGFSEHMRAEGRKKTDRAILSRAVSAIRGKTIIVNLPGSPRGAVESLDAIAELLPHSVCGTTRCAPLMTGVAKMESEPCERTPNSSRVPPAEQKQWRLRGPCHSRWSFRWFSAADSDIFWTAGCTRSRHCF